MPKIVDHDARRAQVLDAAFALFDERGYGAVSMRDLAASVGASTGTLYHYFDGKDALFQALVRRRFEADLADALAAIPDGAAPEVRLAVLGSWVGRHVPQLAGTLRLVLDYLRQDGTPDGVREVLAGYRGPLADALGPDLAGPALSLVLGMLVHHLIDADAVDEGLHLRALGSLATLGDVDEVPGRDRRRRPEGGPR